MTKLTIDFPQEFVERLDRCIENCKLGYESREEFLRESVRQYLKKTTG